MKIGVIGIGAMERPIAENLLKAGHSVAVYNRTLAHAEQLRSSGAIVTKSLSKVCQADVVLTMLADDDAVEALVFRSKEFLPSFSGARVHVSMGTIEIGLGRKLTEAHAKVVFRRRYSVDPIVPRLLPFPFLRSVHRN